MKLDRNELPFSVAENPYFVLEIAACDSAKLMFDRNFCSSTIRMVSSANKVTRRLVTVRQTSVSDYVGDGRVAHTTQSC